MDASLTASNSCSTNCCQSIDNCERTINEPTLEQHRKHNFRQLLRSLREDETNSSGPLLASSEDQSDATDNEGFIIVPHKHRKNRKSRNVQNGEENVNLKVACNNSVQSESTKDFCGLDEKDPDDEFKFEGFVRNNEINESNPCFSPSDEICLRIEEPKTTTAVDTKKKRTWLNAPQNNLTRIIDFSECPICFQPLSKDKIILEECGHCFHSECIRMWMKQKSTCPFCAGYSLLPDEFPRLT